MAGNLIGEPFEDYVNKQIKRRQKIQGESNRSLDEIQYLSNRNAWIKLASGVSISSSRMDLLKKNGNALITDANITTGQDLAQNYVLFNGLTEFSPNFIGVDQEITEFNQQQRAGVRGLANNPNPAYGVGGTDFGYSPMPGITDMEFRCLNRGSIKKATLNIKAHNRDQFDIIDVLYLRLGYSVFIEWGYDKYIDNSGNLQQMNETLIDGEFWRDKYADTDYSLWLPQIEKRRRETGGNYDGAFGTISNFSWDFASDGTYNIKVEIISLGDIVESLKVNLPTIYPGGIPTILSDKFATLLQNDPDGDVPENLFYSLLYPGLSEVISNWYKNKPGSPPDIKIGNGIDIDYLKASGITAEGGVSNFGKYKCEISSFNEAGEYTNPFEEVQDEFKVEESDILEALSFSLTHGLISYDGGEGTTKKYQENFTRNKTINFDTEPNQEAYGYFGTKWLIEGPGINQRLYSIKDTGNIFSQAFIQNAAIRQFYRNSNYFTSVFSQGDSGEYFGVEIKVSTGKQADFFIGSTVPDLESYTAYFTLIPIPVDNPTTFGTSTITTSEIFSSTVSGEGIQDLNIITSNEEEALKASNLYKILQDKLGAATSNPKYKWDIIKSIETNSSTSQAFLQQFAGSSEGNTYLNSEARDIWQKNYDLIKSKNPDLAWDYLLNCKIDGVDFSPNEEYIKNAVYQYFRLQGKASPTPITEAEEKATALPEDDPNKEASLREVESKNKDLQNRNRNRIYRFFYDIRTGNEDSINPFIAQTLGTLYSYFPDSVKVFPDVPFGDSITLGRTLNDFVNFNDYSDDPVILRLTGMQSQIQQNFIRLDYFLYFLVDQIIPKIEKTRKELITIEGIELTEKTICYVIDNVISLDIRKLIINNNSFIKGIDANDNAVPSPLFPEGLAPFVQSSSGGSLKWGNLMNIYFNFTRLEEIFDTNTTTTFVSLFEALKTICNDINDALGGINNIEPVITEDNTIKFIDQTPIPGLDSIAKFLNIDSYNIEPEKEAVLEVFGYNNKNNTSNFVTNIGLSTQIDKNYATAITIGATANGGVPGIEATAFSKWNVGITDRFKSNIVDGATEESSTQPSSFIESNEYGAMKENYGKFLNQNANSLIGLTEEGIIEEGYIKYNKNTASNWYNTIQIASTNEKDSSVESSIGFLPFNLKIDMDGLSGIKLYNRVKVNTSFLPSNYPDTLEFIITQVNHKLSSNGWTTSLETIATSKNQKV